MSQIGANGGVSDCTEGQRRQPMKQVQIRSQGLHLKPCKAFSKSRRPLWEPMFMVEPLPPPKCTKKGERSAQPQPPMQ